MRECSKCKSSEYTNKNLVMMINECGHPLCKNCVDNLFARNAGPCHMCGRTLKKNNFWEQIFDDPIIEKENHIRKRLKKIYNLKLEDFPSLRDFNDYLERFEHIVFNLTEEIDVEQTEAEVNAFREGNSELIERNRRKNDGDTLWVLENLKEERDMKNRMSTVHQQENKEVELTAVRDTKAIIDEIKDSDVPAEVILDRERKRQIEIDMEEKEKAADRKRRQKEAQSHRRPAELSFGHQAQRVPGRSYEYCPIRLVYNGPPLIHRDILESKGYLSHIKAPSKHRLAGGYTAHMGLERALFESRAPRVHDRVMSDIEEAYKYIEIFYNGNDPSGRTEGQRWLTEFSNSLQAWTICDRILHDRKSNLHCWVAAQTIRQKILKSLKEIPEESFLSLRESLINHIGYFHSATGSDQIESIVTQLCLAIADLYIQVPSWNNWIVEFLQRCNNFEGDQTKMMLTLLKVFPEEVQEIRVGDNRRKVIQDELASSAPHVIEYLTTLLSHNPNQDTFKRIYSCLGAYLGNPAMSTDTFVNSPLLQTAFVIIAMPNVSTTLHDTVTECIVQATLLADNYCDHLALAHSLQKSIFSLAEPFNVAVSLEEFGKLQNFARLFCELTETLLEKIVNETSDNIDDLGSLHSLDLLLLLAGHHDYALIERTFNVWYRISEALFMIEDDCHIGKFRPYINRYISTLYRHSRFDTDEEGLPDENSDFMEFRAKVSETLKDVVYIVGTDTAVRNMCDILTSCSNGTWDEMESALFLISSVVHNLVPEEDSVLPQLMTSITNLPSNSHPILFATSIKLLGACNEWLSKHSEYVEVVVNWLGSLINNPLFAPICAEAIYEISLKCHKQMMGHLPSLVAIIPALESHPSHGKKIEKAVCELLKTICMIIPNLHPDEISMRIGVMCKPIIERLLGIIANSNNPANNENDKRNDSWIRISQDPILWLNRIAIVFKDVPPWQKLNNNPTIPAPWLETSHALFDVVSATLNHYKHKTRVTEYCCRALRYIIRSLGLQSQAFIGRMLAQILEIYEVQPHSCLLYLASILVDEYGELPESRDVLIRMLEVLAQQTFAFLTKENNVKSMMKHNPGSIDDFFRLADRFIERCPSHLFVSPVVDSIVDCAVVALEIDHDEATGTVTKFISNIIRQLISARNRQYSDPAVEAAHRLFHAKGSTIMTSSLNSALFHVSRNLRRNMAEIIYWIGKYDPVAQRKWLEEATAQLPRGGLAATDEQLIQFVKNVTANPTEGSSKDVLRNIRDLLELYN